MLNEYKITDERNCHQHCNTNIYISSKLLLPLKLRGSNLIISGCLNWSITNRTEKLIKIKEIKYF